jgi:hypothetical protein
MAHEAEHPAEVGALCVILDEAERSRVLFDPSGMSWSLGEEELGDCRALTHASPSHESKDKLILLIR